MGQIVFTIFFPLKDMPAFLFGPGSQQSIRWDPSKAKCSLSCPSARLNCATIICACFCEGFWGEGRLSDGKWRKATCLCESEWDGFIYPWFIARSNWALTWRSNNGTLFPRRWQNKQRLSLVNHWIVSLWTVLEWASISLPAVHDIKMYSSGQTYPRGQKFGNIQRKKP